jgi:LemA protein
MNQELAKSCARRRGAIGKGCIVGLAVVAVLAVLALMLRGSYNGLVSSQEEASQKWAAVESQYKRRNDLVPNLVETVKGAADFEKSTITQVTEARASVGRMQMPATLPTDQAQLDAYVKAQSELGSALSRLLVVAENYPQLKATANFADLQSQLEGTENRIAVAREDYTVAVRAFNTRVRSFPTNIIAGMFNFHPLPQLTTPPGELANPKVDFGTGK